MRWAVVAPSNRPERLGAFKEAWLPILAAHDADLVIVHDEPPWEGIPDWIPRRSDMIRSWGFYQAWKREPEFILSLDDDVLPMEDEDPLEHYEFIFEDGAVLSDYLSVAGLTTSTLQMRGFPHRDREIAEVAIQYGGWWGVLDFDAETQLAESPGEHEFEPVVFPIPLGVPVTTCSMNMAWRRQYTPLMWQLPLLDGRYDRYGDIWSGLLQKAVLDALGKVMVINGYASVQHDRASDPHRNLEREAPGREPNETRWKTLMTGLPTLKKWYFSDSQESLLGLYEAAARALIHGLPGDYQDHFRYALGEWLDLFKTAEDTDARTERSAATLSQR